MLAALVVDSLRPNGLELRLKVTFSGFFIRIYATILKHLGLFSKKLVYILLVVFHELLLVELLQKAVAVGIIVVANGISIVGEIALVVRQSSCSSGDSKTGPDSQASAVGPASQLPCAASYEDVICRRIKHPVVAFAWVVVVPRHLDKALVERKVVSDGVLPTLLVLPVVREVFHDELVNAV